MLLFSTTSKFLEFKRSPYSKKVTMSKNRTELSQATMSMQTCYIGYLFRVLHRATLFLQRLESSDGLANRQSGGCICGGVFGECHCWLNTETHKDKIKNTRE